MRSLLRFVLLMGAMVLWASPASADQLVPSDSGGAQPQGRLGDGRYGGVAPGSNTSNPLPKPPSSPPHLIWTGFQPTATGSRVFLQTTSPVEFEVKEGKVGKAGRSSLTVFLRGCRIFMANNRRKIDTRAFATPVQSISAKQSRKDVEVVITLHELAKATPGTDPGPNGSQFLVIDFPPGKPTPFEDRPPAGAESEAGRAPVGDNWSFSDSGANAAPEAKGKSKSKGKAESVVAPAPAAAKGEQVPMPTSSPPAPAK
jgi:hypothetical protein